MAQAEILGGEGAEAEISIHRRRSSGAEAEIIMAQAEILGGGGGDQFGFRRSPRPEGSYVQAWQSAANRGIILFYSWTPHYTEF